MRVRLGEKLHATRLVELLQLLEHLRRMHLKLLNAYARQRERHLEEIAVLLDHLADGVEGGHVRALHGVVNATLVLVVVVIIMVGTDIKETVTFQMDDLMYLKI